MLKKSLVKLYRQYELVTCIFILEPWEKKLINSFVALTLALVIFSSYMYLPAYIETLLQFILPLPTETKAPTVTTPYAPGLQADKTTID